MKTKHVAIALLVALLCSGAGTASAMSVAPKPCPWSDQASTPSLDQQGEAVKKYLSQYDDFANLRWSSKDIWVLSWRGPVPFRVSQLVEAVFAPRSVVSQQVPFNKAQLDEAEKAINLKLDVLAKRGLTNGSYELLRLDSQSFEVVVNLRDGANADEVFADIQSVRKIPMTISKTDAIIVNAPLSKVAPGDCQAIAL